MLDDILRSLEDSGVLYVKKALGPRGIMDVPKIRTMYLDAEKDLCNAKENGYDGLGKLIDDPRIIENRRWMRELGIDEVPQIIYNLIIKGDMSIVGIRPRTEEDWEIFPQEHKDTALRYQPGLMGVQYSVHHPIGFEEMMQVEAEYLRKKEDAPVFTDMKYIGKILFSVAYKLITEGKFSG